MGAPLLRLDAPGFEVAALREVLQRMIATQPATFDALFAPGKPREPVALAPELAHVLASFGLIVDRGGNTASGQLPIRRRGARCYVMALGGVGEYRQDVWPETDAMLAQLVGVPPGRVLDMGTGCGIVAIEAVLAGHTAIATDLYPNTLALAQFNAALNDVRAGLEFRQGHLFDPVAGETFDLVLTAPHYTRVADQLRLEAIRAAAPLCGERGRVVIATFCEWSEGEHLAMVDSVLAEHAAAGYDVRVSPMPQAVKQAWFTQAAPDEPIRGLSSRHRFLVEITRAAGARGEISVTLPGAGERTLQPFMLLRRIGAPAPAARKTVRLPVLAVVADAPDLARLEQLIADTRRGVVALDGELLTGMLDACRWGAAPCVTPDITLGAVGAILDGAGGVRPCAHGGVVATAATPYAGLVDILHQRAADAAQDRGCGTCHAYPVCSRCLFPHVLSEAAYCDTIRRWADVLPAFHRLLAVSSTLVGPQTPLRVKLHRADELLAAPAAPGADVGAPVHVQRAVATIATWWRGCHTAIVRDAASTHWLHFWHDARHYGTTVHPLLAAVGELIGEGATAGQLVSFLDAAQVPRDVLVDVLRGLRDLYATAA